MRNFSFVILLLAQLLLFSDVVQACGEADDGPLMFVQNDGQWDDHIEYRMDLRASSRLYLEKDRLTYVMSNVEDINELHYRVHGQGDIGSPMQMNFHAFAMKMLGANDDVEVSASCEIPFYHNYFIGDDPERWKSNVALHQQVDYTNIYDGIDMSVFGLNMGVKYEFVVHPGADPSDIVLSYEAADNVSVVDGQLRIETSVGDIYEHKPYVFQQFMGQQVQIPCEFVVQDNRVTFHFPDGYDPSVDLVVDPELIFASYTGSVADNWGYSATYDEEGNFYGGGIVFGTQYPASLGAFQVEWAGGEGLNFTGYGIDISVFKWSPDGVDRIYASFLGGAGNEIPQSMVVNSDNELIIYGSSSSEDFPTTSGVFDESFNGGQYMLFTNVLEYVNGSDIIVSRFSADGSDLEASTFIGGSNSDGLNGGSNIEMLSAAHYNYGDHARGEVLVDSEDNIIICSSSFSDDFPVTTNAIQSDHGGQIDGVVFKFNPGLDDLMWSTYLGGSSDDAGFGLELDSEDNVYISGSTNSADFVTTSGVLNEDPLGGLDAFIAKISANGDDLMASTYLGTDVYDQGFFLELDNEEDLYLVGQTLGDYPVEGDVFTTENGTIFLQKLTSDLTTPLWSTRFGGSSGLLELVPTAFLVDRCEQIYLCGWGGSTNNNGPGDNTTLSLMDSWPITADAFKPDTDGSDFYLMILTREAEDLLYGTYFGGTGTEFEEHVDGGTSRFDKNGIVYQAVCASCGIDNDNFPTTPGVWSQLDSTETRCNYGAFKFEFDLIEVIADFSYSSSCDNPLEIAFINNSINGTDYVWDFGEDTSSEFAPVYEFPGPGEYLVSLFVDDPEFCQDNDSTEQLLVISETIDASFEPQDFCIQSNPTALVPSIAGGEWSGDGIDEEGVFDPSIGVGDYEVTYTFSSEDCSSSTTETVTVTGLPDADFTGLQSPYCETDDPVALVPNLEGGEFSGPGVVDNTFDPGLIENTGEVIIISYTVSNEFCENTGFSSAVVLADPEISLDPAISCVESGILQLSASPPGGAWSGEHITASGAFNTEGLEPGFYSYTYTVSNDVCQATEGDAIWIVEDPQMIDTEINCLEDGTAGFELIFGFSGPYADYQLSLNDQNLEAVFIGEEGPFTLTFPNEDFPDILGNGEGEMNFVITGIQDSENNCTSLLSIPVPDCPICTPFAGEMTAPEQIVCYGGTVSAQTTGEFVDEGSELWYVLHDSASDSLGQILASNQSGDFALAEIEGLQGNQHYYISPVVGPSNGGELPDLDNACTDTSAGALVVMLKPVVFEVNEYCDWVDGEYIMTTQVTGGLPSYEAGQTYVVNGFYSDDNLLPEQTFTIIIPSTDGMNVSFNAEDALGCQGAHSSEILCFKTSVELLDFEGKAEDRGNRIMWTTALEENSAKFVVERLGTQGGFAPIATVAGAGNSSVTRSYEILDTDELPAIAYYRLQSVDYNGTVQYSPIISVQRHASQDIGFSFWPNPARDRLFVASHQEEKSTLKVTIFDQLGRKLLEVSRGASGQRGPEVVDLQALTDGLYLIQLQMGNGPVLTQKLIIK